MTVTTKTIDLRSVLKHGLTAFMAVAVAMGTFTAMALADKGGNKDERGHGKSDYAREHHDDHGDKHDEDTIRILIGTQNRDAITDYLNRNYRKDCPPGLAKKNNGCLPPGIAKKYQIGSPLSDTVRFMPIPRDLRDLLKPAPRGYQYVQVDQDVLLISEASKMVIDAVTLLSAVGN